MDFVVGSSLKILCNTLKSEIENKDLQNFRRLQLIDILNTLEAKEKFLVAKYFCKLSWNLGSLNILSILQRLGILTATEYILSFENSEEVQLVLNDFLESRFELITNLLLNSTIESSHSLKISIILDECLENLFKDLVLRPELNDLRFLNYEKPFVTADVQLNIVEKVLLSILSLQQTKANEAFLNFSTWINQGVDDLRFPLDLYNQLLLQHTEESLNILLTFSTSDNFKEWKFYLIMLQTISSKNNEVAGPFIRKYLKLRLKLCATLPCKRNIMHILLTARAATATTIDISTNLNNYAEWYKSNIGEMKFFLKGEEFHNILTLLDQCIKYEMEVDYLEIHTIVVISPQVLCGNLIRAYKTKCKQRLQQIKTGNLQMDALTESVLIEDSN